jgi:hypothetical protein
MAEQFVRRRALFIRLDLARLLDEEPRLRTGPGLPFCRGRLILRAASIGPPYVFAMDVPVGGAQHESGSASFGIIRLAA